MKRKIKLFKKEGAKFSIISSAGRKHLLFFQLWPPSLVFLFSLQRTRSVIFTDMAADHYGYGITIEFNIIFVRFYFCFTPFLRKVK